MYLDHFGLKQSPFDNTPDPSFFYASEAHREALAALIYGIQNQKGIILITGEVGTGKSLLVRKLWEQLPKAVTLLEFEAPGLRPKDIIQRLAELLGVRFGDSASREEDFKELKRKLHQKCRNGKTIVLLFDEAQDLSDKTLGSMRRLSNLEVDGERLLQIVLLGQTELLNRLQTPVLRALLQRVALHRSLSNLTQAETIEYIGYRCQKAGATASLFTMEAMRLVHQASGGAPRMINHICDNALMAGYADGLPHIDASTIWEVMTQLPFFPLAQATSSTPQPPAPLEPPSPPGGDKIQAEPASPEQVLTEATPRPSFLATLANKPWLWLGGGVLLSSLTFLAYDGYHSAQKPIPHETTKMSAAEVAPAQPKQMPATREPLPLPDTPPSHNNAMDEDLADVSLEALLDLPPPEDEPPRRKTADQGKPQEVRQTPPLGATDGKNWSSRITPRLGKPENTPAVPVEHPVLPPEPVTPVDTLTHPPAPQATGYTATPPTTAPRQLPLPAFSDETPQDRFVRIAPGQSLSKLAAKHYGLWTATIRDIIRAANPRLRNLDVVPRGTWIRLPQVTAKRLVVAHEGAFYVYLRTAFGRPLAQRIAAQLSRRGEKIVVVADQDNRAIYRIYLGPYPTRQAAEQAGTRIRFSPTPELR